MHTRAKLRAGLYQFASVIAVGTADDDNHVALLRQFNGRILTLFCWLADRIHESDLGRSKQFAHALDELPDFFDWLGRLRDDTEAWSWSQPGHVFAGQNDVKIVQIPGQATHFNMVAAANDDRMKPLGHQ